jgi:hypothetical protein
MLSGMSAPVRVHAARRRERVLEIAAVLMLSLASVGIAWSGYQAAKWSGIQTKRYAQASRARSLANRAATLAEQDRTQDLLNFNRWLELSTQGNALQASIENAGTRGITVRPRRCMEFVMAYELEGLRVGRLAALSILTPRAR